MTSKSLILKPNLTRSKSRGSWGGLGVGAQLTRSRSGYRAHVKGGVHKASVPSGLAISCGRRGNGLRLTIRPRRRGRTLKQVGVTKLAVALYNPTSASVAARTTFTVQVPH